MNRILIIITFLMHGISGFSLTIDSIAFIIDYKVIDNKEYNTYDSVGYLYRVEDNSNKYILKFHLLKTSGRL